MASIADILGLGAVPSWLSHPIGPDIAASAGRTAAEELNSANQIATRRMQQPEIEARTAQIQAKTEFQKQQLAELLAKKAKEDAMQQEIARRYDL